MIGRGLDCGIAASLEALAPMIQASGLALIDIPIGLVDASERERDCDRAARALLGRPRAASVFPVPCRAVVESDCSDYGEVCAINRAHTGRALSKQGFNILPKIREADRLLREHPDIRGRLRESHPELVFQALAGGCAMAHNKKSALGSAERLALLDGERPGIAHWLRGRLHALRADHGRLAIQPDDLADAAALALASRRCRASGMRPVPEHPPRDSAGLAMEMVLFG
jgi:predicted RNase H-like nuclease